MDAKPPLESTATTEGRAAYFAGKSASDNPYPRYSDEWSDWDTGFVRQLLKRLVANTPKPD